MAKKELKKRKPLISALEPRVLFDGAAITTAVDVLDNTSFATDTQVSPSKEVTGVPVFQAVDRDRKEIAFVDTTVEDYKTLVNGIDSNIEVFEISSTDDIENILNELRNVDSIHILSHGNTGEITIGDEVINSDTLSQFEDVMNLLKTSLSQDGDILLYGCNVASDGQGQDFINEIASLTSADVAASDDITGSAQLNGDWDLEVESGSIETDEIVIENYNGKLEVVSTFEITENPPATALSLAPGEQVDVGIYYFGTRSTSISDRFYNFYGSDYTNGITDIKATKISTELTSTPAVDLLIVFQPQRTNNAMSAAEITALSNFLDSGGRIFFVGEHNGYAPNENATISDAIARLNGNISVLGGSYSDTLSDNTGPVKNLNNHTLLSGVSTFRHNAFAQIELDPAISEAVIVDDSNRIVMADQALSYGRVTLITDQNWTDDVYVEDNEVFLKNLAIDSFNNVTVVDNGGNPNAGFGMNAAAAIAEDTDKADFVASDFSVSGSNANAIQITTAPTNGTLLYNGSALTYTSGIATITSFDATLLTYSPDANYNGTDSFSWAGSTDGGSNYTASSATVTITIDPVNDKPTASNNTLTVYEEHPYAFSASDFGFSDIDGDTLSSVLIANTNISNGTLELTGGVNAGVITSTEVTVSKADIDAGYLVFTSDTDYHGTGDYFRFKVNDGTENSGSYYNMYLNVTNTNDAPNITNTDTTPTFIEDSNKTTITSTPVNIVNTSDFALSDYENDGISTIKIQVENISDSGEEYLNIDGSKIDITTASSSTTATNGYSYSVTLSGTTATLTLTTAPSVPLANATGFIKSVTYQNDSDTPTTNVDRVVSLALVDDGGVANSGNNTSAFEKVSDITISASDDNPVAMNMTATIGPNSQRTFAEFQPMFSDADNNPMTDAYELEILSLPTTGTFEVYDYANGSGVDDKTDPSNWITISDISAMSTTSTYTLVDGRFVISMADLDNYRYNAGNNSNTTTSISWRVMTSGDTNDSTGWSNSASGLITIIDSASNTAPSIVSFVDTANATISNGGTFTIPENGTANDLTKLTMVFSDDYTPEDYINVVITSSDNSIIEPANIVENKSTTTTSGDTRTFNIVPVSDATGTVTLTFTMSDGDKTTTYSIDVVVNENPEIYNPGSVLTVPDINSYVEIADSPELQVQTYTYSIWVKPDTISSQWQPLIMKASDSGLVATRNFSMWIRPDSLQLHNTFFNTQTNSQVHIDTDSSHQLTQNEWNLITATYDGATLKTYINGDLAASIATTGTPINDSSSLFIGGLPNGYSTLGAFSGDIAEVSIYNDALTDVEIKDTMKTQLTGSEDNLVYYTRFTTDSNGDIIDLTATNNSGVLNGNADVSKQVDLDRNSSYSTFTPTDFSTNFLYTDAENDSFAGVKVVTIPSNGTLELSGVAVSAGDIISSADIANLVYTPNVDFYGTDSFSYQAQDDIGGFSNTALFDLTVNYIDTEPKIMGTTTLSVDEDSGATTISGFTVTDYYGANGLGDHTLTAKVVATNGVLAIATAGSTTVVGNGTNTVTITGTAAQIQSAVNTLSYTPDAEYSGTDPLDISIKDDTIGGDWKSYFASETGKFYNPNNGHYYEYVSVSGGISWTDAKIAAEKSTLYGLQGYLANVSTQAENDYVKSLLGGTGWFGANDLETEGSWVWAGGPEEGLAVPLNPDVSWDPWNSGEPNDHGSGEDAGQYRDDGTWNDLPTSYSLNGYVVEYGGFKNDAALEAAQLIVTVNGVNDAPIITATGVDGGANPEYIENDDPITLLDNVVITDADNTTLKNATVSISNNFTPGDILSFTNDGSTMGNIEGSYDATTGELTLVSPSYGDSFVFDGNDDYIDLGTIEGLSGSFSMEASIKVSDNTQNWARIFDLGQGSENDNIFFGFAGSTGKITIAIYDDQNGNFNGIETVNTLDENAWVHVAGVSNGDGTFSIYFDGVEQDVTIKSGSTTSLVSNSVSRDSSYIGKSNWSADADFAGEIKEARIWNDARSEAEIKANMNQALDLNDSLNNNLLGYWTTSTNGNTVLDLSGNSNDGTLQGDTSISYNGTGTATIQEWENALKSIEFSSTSFNPGTQKEISWSVDDGQTVDNISNVETTTIDIKELYSEQETNYQPIDSSIDLSSFGDGSNNFGGKYVEFDVNGRTSTEDLGFVTASSASTANDAITIVGNSVYLGNGSTASVIGQIDPTYNGQDGKSLRINFAVDFANGDFSDISGVTQTGNVININGWSIHLDNYIIGTTAINGITANTADDAPATRQSNGQLSPGDDRSVTTGTKYQDNYAYEFDDGGLRLYHPNIFKSSSSDYGYVAHGPYAVSDSTVALEAGDKVSFNWKALGGNDAYDIYAYLQDETTSKIIELIDENGTYSNKTVTTNWGNSSLADPSTAKEVEIQSGDAGTYRFVFVSGAFDETFGGWSDASLYIDNVKVTQANPPSGIGYGALEEIAKKLTYTDSSDLTYENALGLRGIDISGEDTNGTNYSDTFNFDKIEVNDSISLSNVSEINYVDTDGVDTFASQGGTLTSSDVDANTTPVYSVDGGTVNGTTFTKVGDYGTLTLDSSTGVYTYEPNDSVIDALSESTSESFTLRVSDDNPNGLSTVDTKTLTINITAVNDSPLLGGNSNSVTFTENGSKVLIDSTITISDQEGESYDGGYLFIKNLTNGENSDQLVVTEIGGITLSGSDILYAGTIIGTIDSTYNGVDGKDLKINFNTDAYSVQVQALAQAIAFDNARDDISSDARTYQIQVNDGGEPTPRYSTKDITVNIDAINDLPVISLDSNVYEVEKIVSTNPDGTLNLSGISFSDLDDSSLTVKLETTNYGTLTLNNTSGLTVTGNGTQEVTVSGTIAQINASLAASNGLTYVAGNGNDIVTPGLDKLKITATDPHSGQDIATKDVIVTPAVPNAFSTNIVESEDSDVAVDFEALVNDVNGSGRTFTIGFGTADITDTNGDITTAGSIDTLATEIRDSNNKLIGYQLAHGTLTIGEGTLDDANFVAQFIYIPDTANWNGIETFVYQYTSDDANKTSNIAQVTIVVTAVNDAPTITLSNGNAETIDEDTTLVFEGSKAITLADLDDTGSETFNLTLSVSNGKLDLTQTTGLTFVEGNDGTGKIKVTGTLVDLQAAIDTLSYTPNAEYNGSDNLVITFNDKGNIGQGDVLEDTQTIAITINPINDAPTVDSYVDINITDGSGASIIDNTYVNYLKVSDVDTANLTYKIDNDGSEDVDVNGDVINNSNLVDSKVGTYGTLEIDPTTGKYTFTPDKTAIAALSDDAVESFVLDVFDGTTHKQVTININITADAQTASTYTEQDPATLVLQDTTIDTNESYGGGFIEFEVSSPEATEIVSLEKVTTADTTDGVISIVGSTIFLGDGTTAAAIGQIDGKYNGEDGEKLRINFSVDFQNGDFNATTTSNGLLSSTKGQTITIDGWNIYNGRVDFGSDTIAGLAIPEDTVWPSKTQGSDVGRDSNTITQDKGWMTYLNADTSTDSSIKMYSKMVTQAGFTIIRGPYIYSDSAVSLQAGDSISFDWKAEGGDDAYDVFGYIVNVNDETDYQVILNETGANADSETNWATVSQTVDSAGEYKFVFVSGSWDATGGTWLGAQLYIDDVKVTQANPSSGIDSSVLEKIAQKVTYKNTGDLTATNDVQNKTITITTSSGDNTPVVHSDTKALDIQEVNDDPTMFQPATIYYTDTPSVDDFSDESGTLVANDVDTNTTFTYDITGSTDNGNGTVSLVGDNGTLTLNKTTGAYTFTANDNAINALGESTIETFTVTASDGDGGVATKTVIIDITAVNDGPILGGAKPGDTSGDTYGAYTSVSYTENSSAVAIDPTITVTDPESKSYADGQLKISVTGNKSAGDMLSLISTGGISVDGTDVLYGASVIGSIDSNYDGTNGTDLIINLTDKAFSNEVQALMRAVSYSSLNDYFINTTRTINMEINDGGNGGTTTAALSSKDAIVEITPVNDLPVIDAGETKFEMEKVLGSTTVGTSEDGSLYLTGISFSDADETSDVTVVLQTTDTTTQTDTMSISFGTINAGETFTWGDGSNSVTVTAVAGDSVDSIAQKLVDEINNDSNLNGDYTASVSGNYDGKFSVTALDIDNMFTSSVSDSSTNTDMTAQTTQEVYGLLTVKTGVTNGVTDITGNGTKSVTLVGTLAEINTTLAQSDGLKFVAGNGNDVVTPGVNFLSMSITDSQGGNESFNKEVVVLPAVPNSYSQNITLEEDGFATFDLGSLITDINDNSGYYTFGLVGEAGETEELQDGSINILNLGTISSTPTVITNGNGDEIGFNLDNGTLILENDGVLGSDFAKFTFTPNENWNGTEVIYYQYTSGDGKTGPVSKILLYTGAVNDAPEITSGDILSVNEDTSISFDSANGTRIVIDDLDVTSEELEVTLDVSNGKVTLNDTTGVSILEGTDSNAHIKIRGSLTDLQNALDNMSYQANENFYGSDSLEIEINDLGNIGTLGNKLTDNKTIDITVTNVNDVPTIEIADTSVDEIESNISRSGQIIFNDIDKENRPVLSETMKEISSTGFTLTAEQSQAIADAFSVTNSEGNLNVGTGTWTFEMSESDLDYLAKDEVIDAVFTVTVTDDEGETDIQDITIKITGTNDAPFFGDGSSQTTTETVTTTTPTVETTSQETTTTSSASKEIFNNADFEDGLTGWTSEDVTVVAGTDTITFNTNASKQMTDEVKAILGTDNQMTWEITGSGNQMVKLEPNGNSSEFNDNFQTVTGVSTETADYIRDTFFESSDMKPTNIAYITKTFDAVAGDIYEIAWNYVSGDYVPFNDGSVLTFVNNDDASKVAILDGVKAEVALLGATNEGTSNYTTQSYGSTGWQTSTIQVQESGTYTLTLAAFNLGDTSLNPYLLVDNIAGTTTLNGETFEPLAKDSNAPTPAGEVVETTTTTTTSNAPIEVSLTETNTTLETSGEVAITDLDTTDVVTTSFTVTSVQNDVNGNAMTSDVNQPTNAELEDMFTITTTPIDGSSQEGVVQWEFHSGNEAFNYLAQGETLVLTYTMKATDDSVGASDTQDVIITIIGTNDAPKITVEANDSDEKALNETNSSLQTSGTLSVEDLDRTNVVTSTYVVNTVQKDVNGNVMNNDGNEPNNQAFKDMFTITQTVIDETEQNGELSWAFNSNGESFDYLAQGETLTLTYTIEVDDSEGGSTTKDVTVTITGTNDTPKITVEAKDSDGKALIETDTTLETSGTLSVEDLDRTNVVTSSSVVNTVQKDVSGNVMNNDSNEPNNQALRDMFTITQTVIDETKQNGELSWAFNSNGESFDYLAQGETLTLTYTIEVDDSEGGSTTKDVTVTITGTNDTPKINESSEHYVEIAFGEDLEPQNLKEIFSFEDEDSTDVFEFSVVNVPKGITIDPETGIMSGRPIQSGVFTITVRGTDSQGAYVEKSFDMLVIAPPQPEAQADAPVNDGNEIAEQIKQDIEVNTSNEIVEVEQNNDETGFANDLNPVELTQVQETQQNVENTELTSLFANNNNNPTDRIVSADVDLNVTNDGRVIFGDDSAQSFETVGMVIETIDFTTEKVEFKIVDSRVGQKYTVTLADDSPLPESLVFDPNTGLISGQIPEEMEILEVKVSAQATDGTTRVLKIKIDVKELKQQIENNQAKFETLGEQINAENDKITNYGSFISTLFSA